MEKASRFGLLLWMLIFIMLSKSQAISHSGLERELRASRPVEDSDLSRSAEHDILAIGMRLLARAYILDLVCHQSLLACYDLDVDVCREPPWWRWSYVILPKPSGAIGKTGGSGGIRWCEFPAHASELAEIVLDGITREMEYMLAVLPWPQGPGIILIRLGSAPVSTLSFTRVRTGSSEPKLRFDGIHNENWLLIDKSFIHNGQNLSPKRCLPWRSPCTVDELKCE